jgi:hypothetical protein
MTRHRQGFAIATVLVLATLSAWAGPVRSAAAKPGSASDYFKVLRSPRDANDHLPPTARSVARDVETEWGIDLQRSGIRQVYRRPGNRVWLVPGKGWLCLLIVHRGGYLGCATVSDARRGQLHATFGAGSHGFGWLEEVRVLPDRARAVRVSSENGRTIRPQIRHNHFRALFPTPAELTFRIGEKLVSERFDDGF